jgi:hypothetical protein
MRCVQPVNSNPEIFQRIVRAGAYTGKSSFLGFGQKDDDIYHHISEYTRRNLTFDSDIYNGILGIFRPYEQLMAPIYNLWGIPSSPGLGHRSKPPD